MSGGLTQQQIERYRRDGFVFPVAALDGAELGRFLGAYENLERANSSQVDRAARGWIDMPHLAHRWALDLCACPRVLDAVESLIGADVLLTDSKFFPKPAGSSTFVSWHQDGTYAGYRPEDEVVTAWIGLTDSTPENGCLRMIPGSDRLGQLGHDKTFATDNLLSRGQAIREAIDEGAAVDVRLKAGEMSLHNLNVVHGSGANRTAARRVGIMIGYVTPRVTMSGEENYAAMLVRGRDTVGRWRAAPPPGDP